eukprot:2798912-Alexandrium_andersonii.AAC.1
MQHRSARAPSPIRRGRRGRQPSPASAREIISAAGVSPVLRALSQAKRALRQAEARFTRNAATAPGSKRRAAPSPEPSP